MTKSTKYAITLTIDYFFQNFKDYIKEKDRKTIDYILENSSYDNWKKGFLIEKSTNLIKNYFIIEVSITPVIIPGCWGGVILSLITCNKKLLEDICNKLNLDENEVKIKELDAD